MSATRPNPVYRLLLLLAPVLLQVVSQALLQAQAPPSANDSTIRTNVPLVLLPVTVTENGKFIDGLKPEDFTVSDEGVNQKLTVDTSDTVMSPISMVIAVQTSAITEPALAKIEKVGSFVRPILAGDRGQVAVLAYDREVRELTPFTSDADKLSPIFTKLRARSPKQATLLDALEKSIEMLKQRPESNRRVILFLGESRDRGSKVKLERVIELAQRANVMIYAITYSPQKISWTSSAGETPPLPGAPNYIDGLNEFARLSQVNAADRLARGTGGHQMAFTTQDGLEQVLTIAGGELHNQYLLSFAPLDPFPNRYRRVQVKIPSHPKAVIRARPGYWP